VQKRKVSSKAQAAIEFLLTYGWVLVAVIVVIGALAYFGLFDVSRFTPDKCEISNGFNCKDYMIRENAIILLLENKVGTDLYISQLNFTRNGEQLCDPPWTGAFYMAPGDVQEWTVFCPVGAGSKKQSLGLELEYYKSPLSKHVAFGEISNAVEGAEPGLSEEEICRRAQVGGLCCSLDFYFGPGTKDGCKTKYGYCDVTC